MALFVIRQPPMPKPIRLFLFDLDGTLIDSKLDIANSVHHTLAILGLPQISNEEIYRFVGNGVTPLIQRSIHAAGGPTFEEALDIFKAHYMDHCLDTTRLFDGVKEILERFSKTPKIVITNKSQNFSDKIVNGLNLLGYFKGIYGGDTAFPKKPDPTLPLKLMSDFGVKPLETVIIGDSAVDIRTGKNAGIVTCGATYGFRSQDELIESGADFLVKAPSEIKDIFDSN